MPGQGNRVEAFDAAGKPFPLSSGGFTDMSDDGMTSIQTFQLSVRAGNGLPATAPHGETRAKPGYPLRGHGAYSPFIPGVETPGYFR
jgi:hypothetical protein